MTHRQSCEENPGADNPQRRRLQAPHLPLLLPGSGGGRPPLHEKKPARRPDSPGHPAQCISTASLQAAAKHVVQMVRVGARNMQNFQLLREVGRSGHPVLLTQAEVWLATIDHLAQCCRTYHGRGKPQCCPLRKRGIRTYRDRHQQYTGHQRGSGDPFQIPSADYRNIQPRHRRPRARCRPLEKAIAAGADGIYGRDPQQSGCALSDGPQSLTLPHFQRP